MALIKKTKYSWIKWAGSKAKISRDLVSLFQSAEIYVEPFVGSGASLVQAIESGKYKRYIINDINEGLMASYNKMKTDVRGMVKELMHMADSYNACDYKEEFYYQARRLYNQDKGDYVLFWFLMKCGFNGLYRENKSGEFNGPWGHKDKIAFTDQTESQLYNLATALRNVELYNEDFETFLQRLDKEANQFIYNDPPYCGSQPYTAEGFDNKRLANYAKQLTTPVAISDIDTDLSREVYRGMNMTVVAEAKRVINIASVSTKLEVLYTNY